MPDHFILIRRQPLIDFAHQILEASAMPRATAELVAESLVSANLRGVDSHGVQLLLWYTEQIRIGNIGLHTRGHVASENGACMIYDGDHGIGQLIADICCDHAIRLAAGAGVGIVTARNSTHFGACAWWAQKIAATGCVAIVSCDATPLVAPWQGCERMLGTNPICMAVPGPKTFLLDMATTTVALNRIYKALLSGDTTIPPGWAMDAGGNPTTDPQVAADGLPMPLGGYKGYGLAVMMEILCAVLSGGAMLTQIGGIRTQDKPMRANYMFLAIDVARFLPLDEFGARMQWLRDTLKSSQPASGFEEVLIAGDPEWRCEELRLRDGIPVARRIWDQLEALARSLNVPAPALESL